MHISSADAVSANGKISRGLNESSHTWTSAEDWAQFQKLRDSFDLIIMGRNTYDAVQPKPEAARLRIILTHHPEKYTAQAIPGQLEFTSEPPGNLVKLLEKRGYTRALLVGGKVNTEFWEAGLVDEAFITIEPLLFGRGQALVEGLGREPALRLSSVRQLNERGTLLLHYLVDRGKSIR